MPSSPDAKTRSIRSKSRINKSSMSVTIEKQTMQSTALADSLKTLGSISEKSMLNNLLIKKVKIQKTMNCKEYIGELVNILNEHTKLKN